MLDSLNCLGHSVFHDEVNNVETSFAELKVKNQSNRLFLPNNVQPSLFVTFIYENCEIIQKSFLVHLHVTNGIIIQLSSKTEEAEQSVNVSTPKFHPRGDPSN